MPDDWKLSGITRGEPEVAPVENGAAGSAGSDGNGNAAWRRSLAPHHRDLVRRFFDSDGHR